MTTYADQVVIYGSSRVTYNGGADDTVGIGAPPDVTAGSSRPAAAVTPASVDLTAPAGGPQGATLVARPSVTAGTKRPTITAR